MKSKKKVVARSGGRTEKAESAGMEEKARNREFKKNVQQIQRIALREVNIFKNFGKLKENEEG